MLNAVTPSWRWILLIAIGVLCTMINTVDVHGPVMSRGWPLGDLAGSK